MDRKTQVLWTKIIGAIARCNEVCEGHCDTCPYDDERFRFGFSYCKHLYREALLEHVKQLQRSTEE